MNILQIGKVLKSERIKQGLSQKAVAEKTGFHVSSIRNMEQGKDKILFSRYVMYAYILDLSFVFNVLPNEEEDNDE